MSEWLTTKTGKQNCPCCKMILDATSSNEGNIPIPGDISLCGYCAFILKFESDMELRELVDIEFELLDEEIKSKLRFLQSKILELK